MLGIRPAVNAGLSVSRVGGAAQTKAMKKVAGRLRLELAQYRALAAFAQFGTADLDRATRNQLERGQRSMEVLKQPQSKPASLADEVAILYAVVNGHLDDVPTERVAQFEEQLITYLRTSKPEYAQSIQETQDLAGDAEEALKEAITFVKQALG